MAYTILVVDDDTDSVAPLEEKLAFDGHRVVTAETGKKALSAFHQHPVDLVLLDLMLPNWDGLQICRHLRSRSAVPIIVLSAREGVADKVLALDGGADDYVVKPFDYLELAARIRVRMRRDLGFISRSSHDCVRVGKLTLYPPTRKVEINGRMARLTHKEYELLSLFCQRAGQVVDRQAIRQALWPKDQIYRWSRAMDVHIQHIRAKIEAEPSSPQIIRTAKGVGYFLCLNAHGE